MNSIKSALSVSALAIFFLQDPATASQICRAPRSVTKIHTIEELEKILDSSKAEGTSVIEISNCSKCLSEADYIEIANRYLEDRKHDLSNYDDITAQLMGNCILVSFDYRRSDIRLLPRPMIVGMTYDGKVVDAREMEIR